DRDDPRLSGRRRHRAGEELRAGDAEIGIETEVGGHAGAGGEHHGERGRGDPHSWTSARSVTASSPRLVGAPLADRPVGLVLWLYSGIRRPWAWRSAAVIASVDRVESLGISEPLRRSDASASGS